MDRENPRFTRSTETIHHTPFLRRRNATEHTAYQNLRTLTYLYGITRKKRI